MKSRIRGLVIASGLCAALILTLPGIALADSSSSVNAGGHTRASGSFTSNGEIFRVTDRYADGYGVMILYSAEGHSSACINSGGTGTTRTCNLSFAEGAKVTWRVCYGHGSTWWDPVGCGPTKTDRA